MASITTQIEAIQNAQYGSQVRTAICTALTVMNVESDAAVAANTEAQTAKTAAQTAATNANSYKTAAANSANSAASSATSASDSANSAASSATSASNSASTATAAKNDAVSAKTDAQSAATNAEIFKTSAASSASAANNHKTSAANSANSAASSAYDALTAKTYVESVASMVSDIEDYIQALYFSSRNHRNILRGKNLGTSITAAQWAAIQSGEFTDMYIGDYWVLNETKYYIADIDLMYNRTESRNGNELKLHHLFMIPNKLLSSNKVMYDSEGVSVGYRSSKVATAVSTYANTTLTEIFGDHLLNVKHTYQMSYSDGIPQSGSFTTSTAKATIPTEKQIFGFPVNSILNDGSNGYRCEVEPYGQLAIFALDRLFLSNLCSEIFTGGGYIWLQDTCSATEFAVINEHGIPDARVSNTSNSILPLFCIGVEEESS